MAGGDFEGMSIEELCDWANGLGVCRVGIVEEFGKPCVKASGEKVHITMSFSRFLESVPEVGGFRAVSFDTFDDRDGHCCGYGCNISFLDKLERSIVCWVDRLDLRDDQLRLF